MAGEELPDLRLRSGVEWFVVAAPDFGKLGFGEGGERRVVGDVGFDQVGQPLLRIGGEGGAGFVEDGVETSVHEGRIAGTVGGGKRDGWAGWVDDPTYVC